MSALRKQFRSRFEEFIRSRELLAPSARVVLSVSGGVDSMTMLSLFVELQRRWNLTLSIGHVNHQLRGEESDGDEAFVRHTAESLGFSLYSARVATKEFAHTHNIGKQEAARELRYRFLEQVKQEAQADAVATAHNADDNAETVLMNALRGSGMHGLAGIPLRREQGSVIRPMLFAYRKEINQFASEAGVAFREDSSNASHEYTRNRIRLNVIPYLEASLETNIAQSLNRISEIMREAGQRVFAETAPIYSQVVSEIHAGTAINIPELLKQSPLVQDEILLSVFRKLNVEPRAEKLFNVLDLCAGQTGRSLSLSSSVTVYRDRDHLVLRSPLQLHEFTLPIEIGRHYKFDRFEFLAEPQTALPKELRGTSTSEFVDSERLGTQLVLRNWRTGDWFIPLGLHNKKKLSDFFVDAKVPLFEKQHVPVLESNGEIVWVCGYRLDERFMVTPTTASVVKLQYVPNSNVHTTVSTL